MPLGLTNTPLTSQCLMETCLLDLNLNWCIIYLDDILIFLKDLACHLMRLEAMFQKLEQVRLKPKPLKCKLLCKQSTYLGHIISDGDWWRENKCYWKVVHPHHHHWGPELSLVHWILSSVYPHICADSLASAWIGIWQKNIGKKRATITWNDIVPAVN